MKKILISSLLAISSIVSFAADPTVQASNIQFTGYGTTTLSFSWTRGNGDYCLVVVHPYSSGTSYPVDGTNYTSSSTYGNGSNLGNTNYVVAETAGSSMTVFGLTQNTHYSILIYEYEYTGFFYKTPGAGNTHYTLDAAPTAQATALTASSITSSSATLSWTSGNGVYELVSLRQSTSNSNLPVDGNLYTASSAFGSGAALGSSPYSYVVYSSSGTAVGVSNLSSATNYVANCVTYNGASSYGNENYYTTGYPTVGFTTLATQPTAISTWTYVTDISDTAFTINWMKPSGSGTNTLVTLKFGTVNSNLPTDATAYTANTVYGSGSQVGSGAYVVYNSTGNSVRVTGLTAGNTYTAAFFEYNGGTGTYNNTHNYYTSSYATVQGKTNDKEPTVSSSGLVLTPSTNSVSATWTSGNGYNRMVSVKPARIKTALAFDGTDDYVNIPYTSALQPSSQVTLEAWAYKSDWSTGGTGIIAGNYYSGGYLIYVSGSNAYGYITRNGTSTANTYTNVSYLTSGWHHFAISYDGRYTKFFVDGALKDEDDAGGTYSITYTYSNNFTIGAQSGTGTTPVGNYFNGYVDEVRVWNTARTYLEIRQNMNESMKGNETGLAAEWKMDDGFTTAATAVNNSLNSSALNGTLTNMPSTAASSFTGTSGWLMSGANVDSRVDFNYSGGESPAFLNGVLIDNGYHGVYYGLGNSVNVTGLTPGTYYNFCVYEVNDNVEANYLTSSYLTGDVQTLAAPLPTITSYTPASGSPGTIVTINGTNFDAASPGNNYVFFGTEKATVISATSNQLQVIVPYCTNNPYISVEVNTLTAFSRNPFILTSSCAANIDGTSFSSGTTGSGSNMLAVAAGDMDLDGKTDLIGADYLSNSFTVTRNVSSNGTLAWGTAYSFSTQTYPYDIKVVDFDGDNKLDVVASCIGPNILSVFRNKTVSSTISFDSRMDFAAGSNPFRMTVSDIDKDGKPDIIVGSTTAAYFSVFRNTSSVGYISFAPRVDIAASSNSYSIASADIDGDGKNDVVIGSSAATGFSAFRNTSTAGAISFAASVSVSTSNYAYSLALADMDNDGKPDVIVGLNNNTIKFWKNNAVSGNITAGNFSAQASTLTTLATLYGVDVYDLDGDGKHDVVAGYSSGAANISAFEQTTAFAFGTRADYTSTGTETYISAIADFSMDGKPEIISSSGSTVVNVFNNDMNPLASEPTTSSSGITFTSVLQTAMTFTFTAGNGADRIVIARKGSAVNVTPFDGASYTPNSLFGSGTDLGGGQYVVYNSNGNSVTVTGLESYSTYYFSIFEFNGSTCLANYLTTSSASNSNTTLNTPPTLSNISNPSDICENSGQQSIGLTGIGTGAANETQTLSLTASSNNTALIPNGNISFSYTSPNPTGTIFYTSANGQSGTAVITVTVNDGAGNNNTTAKTFTVTVIATPSASNAGPDQNICTPSTSLAGNNPSSGTGTWSFVYTSNGAITINSPNSYNSSIDNFNTGDSVRLVWTIANSPCASSVDSMSIKRVVCPLDAEFSASQTSFCGSSANVTYTDLSTAASTTVTAWAWTFTGGSPNSSSSQTPGVVAYTSPGVYSVILQITDNTSATNTETKIDYITVTALPGNPGAISGNTTVCQGSQSQSYSIVPISGATTYTWTVPSGASIISGQGNDNIVVDYGTSAATGNITVMGQNSCGNGGTGFQLITVNPLPGTSTTISGPASVCQGQNGVVFSTASLPNAATYTWTVPSGATISGPNTGSSITVNFSSSASSGNVDVMGVNSCGTGASSGGMTLSVNPLPDAAGIISGSASVCENDTVSFSIASLGNTNSYTWNIPSGASVVSGSGTNAIMVAFPVGASSGSVSVYGVNSCGNGTSSSLSVTVNPLPASATAIFGNATVCAGDNSEAYFVSAITNAANYFWTLPSGFTITAGGNTNGIQVSLSPTAQSGVISVYGNNSCGDGAASTFSVTVSPLPDSAGTITGADSVCQGQTAVVYSVPTIANASGYNWTIPTGASISSGSNTNSITVDFSATTNSGFITVIGTNSCGNGFSADSFAVVVNPLPDVAGIVYGSDTVCQGDTVSYYIGSVVNATSYTWSLPNGAAVISGNNSDSITVAFSSSASSGNINVSGTNSCGNGISSGMTITVNPLPDSATAILGNATVCAGAAGESYFVSAISDAVNNVWVLPSGFTITSGANTNSILVDVSSSAVSGIISVHGNNSCGDGIASSFSVTVTPLPDSAGTISGADSVCQGQSGVIYSVPSISNATGYNWTLPAGATIVSGNNTNSITVDFSTSAASGFVTVIGTNSCGNGLSADSFAVTVNPLPGAAGTIMGDSAISICPVQSGVVYSIFPVTNATGYTWVVPTGATIVSGNGTNTITVDYVVTAQSGNITVTPTNACGNGASLSAMITVDSVQSQSICIVTVDSTSTQNFIIWEKPVTTGIDSFRIYREIASIYTQIGGVHYSAVSEFVDTTNGVNPNITSYKYEVSAIDSCGNESPLSAFHRTIHLAVSPASPCGYNLSWNDYIGFPVAQYRILRDSIGNGIYLPADSVSFGNNAWTDINCYAITDTVSYIIEIDHPSGCTSSIKNPSLFATNLNSSRSNIYKIADTTLTGIIGMNDNYAVLVYPNPNMGQFTIEMNNNTDGGWIKIYNTLGEEVKRLPIVGNSRSTLVDMSGFAMGIYHLQLNSGNKIINKKIIIQ